MHDSSSFERARHDTSMHREEPIVGGPRDGPRRPQDIKSEFLMRNEAGTSAHRPPLPPEAEGMTCEEARRAVIMGLMHFFECKHGVLACHCGY